MLAYYRFLPTCALLGLDPHPNLAAVVELIGRGIGASGEGDFGFALDDGAEAVPTISAAARLTVNCQEPRVAFLICRSENSVDLAIIEVWPSTTVNATDFLPDPERHPTHPTPNSTADTIANTMVRLRIMRKSEGVMAMIMARAIRFAGAGKRTAPAQPAYIPVAPGLPQRTCHGQERSRCR